MTEREIKDRISSYKDQCEEMGGEFPIPAEDVDAFFANEDNVPESYRDAYQRARNGDFSQFDTLPLFLRNVLGAIEVRNFINRFSDKPSYDNPELKDVLKEKAMNAAFRAGMFALKRSTSEEHRKIGETCDKLMSYNIMQKTMMPPTEQETQSFTETVGAENAPAELERNLARQRVMAKAFLMAQIGKYEVVEKGKPTTELNETIAETLAHGGRTNYILPKGLDSGMVFDALWGPNRGQAAGVYKRSAATHYASRRKIDDEKVKISSNSKEAKVKINPLRLFRKQNGMDLAVGGIGAKGPGTTPITGRGESGHAYMRAEKGDEKHCGSLLLGIEGCAPQSSSNLGSTHGIRAIPGKQSAFLSGKGAVGNKLGGRQVDLSAISSQELAGILNSFDQRYTELQNNSNTPEGRQKLAEINDMLIGKPMETEKLIEMFNDLGINNQEVTNTINKAREGYYASKINVAEMTKEDYQQNIRKGYNTKEACKIAKARFESAGNDLELSVGAIKELMFTHATRPSNFYWRHPFKNRDEKKTINSLLKKLETEKHFSRDEIASELIRGNDTFALNWGNGLSNDPREIKLISDKSNEFFTTPSKLTGILTEAASKYHTNSDIRRAAESEQSKMAEEFRETLPEDNERLTLMGEGKIPATSMREQFVCHEADNSLDSSISISDRVEPTQQKDKQKQP